MPEAAGGRALLRLMAWLSPAFPVGAFSYSSGLERSVHDGLVEDAATLCDWIGDLLEYGSVWNDSVLFCEAWRRAAKDIHVSKEGTPTPNPSPQGGGEPGCGSPPETVPTFADLSVSEAPTASPSPLRGGVRGGGDLREHMAPNDLTALAHLAEALAGSLERHRETMLQGEAFLAAARNWSGLTTPTLGDSTPYCVAVGAVAGANGIALDDACPAFVQSVASNMIQAAIRLSVLGQAQAVGLLAALEPAIVTMANRATQSTLDDLGSATIMAEIASMKHETQHSRLFRS